MTPDDLREVFTVDATAAYSGGNYSFGGVEAIIAFLEDAMGRDDFLSSRRVHHPEIDLTGPDAGARFAQCVWHASDHDSPTIPLGISSS